MTSITIGTVTLAEKLDQNTDWTGLYFNKLESWYSIPQSKAPNTPRPGAHGSFGGGFDWREGATPSVSGGFVGTDEAAALAAMDDLKLAWAEGSQLRMSVDNPLGVTSRLVSVRFLTIPDHRGRKRFEFAIDTFARDPLRYGAPVRVFNGLPVAGGGLTWPITWPLTWAGGGSDGRVTAVNPGTADTFPLLEVTGELSDGFTIDEVGTGRQVRFERLVPAGSTVFMNPRTGRAYLDAPGNDVTTYLTRSDWPIVPKRGQTILQLNKLGTSAGTPDIDGADLAGILVGRPIVTLKTQFPAPTNKAISSADSRASLAGLVLRTTAGVPRAGILPRHANALVAARASMGVDVAAWEGVQVRNNLPAFMANDGTVNVAIGSPPVANSRYDVVYAKQNESESPFSDGNNNELFGFVSGAPSAIPSEAVAIALVPAGGIPLASILIPSTATTTQSSGVVVKQIFPYTALTGGDLWVRLTSELTPLTGFAAGTKAFSLEDGITYRWNGAGWKMWEKAWGPYAPAVTGFSSATTPAVFTGYWGCAAGEIYGEVVGTLGTGTKTISSTAVGLPVAVDTTGWILGSTGSGIPGKLTFLDPGTQQYVGVGVLQDANTVLLKRFNTSGSGAVNTLTTSTPFTWPSGGQFTLAFNGLPVA